MYSVPYYEVHIAFLISYLHEHIIVWENRKFIKNIVQKYPEKCIFGRSRLSWKVSIYMNLGKQVLRM
jgi:hypothetical protein